MAKKPSKPSLDQRIRTDAKLRARVLKNPGLRSKLSDATLAKYAPAQAKSRALTKRLATPIAPGSSVTERDLAHEAQAAQTVRYGPAESDLAQQVGRSQTIERDTGTFYDQYLQMQAQHAAAVAAFQQGAQQALAQTAAGMTGLAGAEGAALQQAANQTAQSGVAPAGDLSALASQAAAVRQGAMGSFQGEQALQGAAANTYADTQARVVAPGQKLGALAQARGRTTDLLQKRSDLRREEGAFNQQFRSDRRSEEFKNQLAMQTLGLNQQKAVVDAASKTPEAAGARQEASSSASAAAKYGYTLHQWRMLGPDGRQRVINAAKAQGKSKPDLGKVNKYGYTESQWRAMSTSQRQQIIKDFAKTGGKPKSEATTSKEDFRQKYGVDLQTTGQHNSFRNQVEQAQSVLKKVGTKDKGGHVTTTQDLVDAMTRGGFSGVPKLPPLAVRAALEVIRYGHILPGTAARMHKAGYSVGTLGYKTAASTRRRDRPSNRNPSGPTSGPGASVPGVGGGAR